MRFTSVVISSLSCALLTACGSSGGTPLAGAPLAPGSVAPLQAVGDDWTTFAHDQRRSGFQAQATGLDAKSVSKLTVRWQFHAADQVYASPLVYGGLVIVCSANQGIVYALDAKSGKVVWQRTLGGQIRLTPTIADGRIFVGTHLFSTDSTGDYFPAPSAFYALDLLSGSIRWQAPLAGPARSAPVVADGRVYVGVAGGDLPKCVSGGVEALDEQTGEPVWSWRVNPALGEGGAVWAPLSYDGSHVIVGTGNTCNAKPVSTANGLVALEPTTGNLAWNLLAQSNSFEDDDTGGGALLVASRAYVINKNGKFYSTDASSGNLVFSKALNVDTMGGWATPTSDGSTILISGGSYAAVPGATTAAATTKSFYRVRRGVDAVSATTTGKMFAMDLSGNVAWTLASTSPIVSYAAIAGGVALINLDANLLAVDLANGEKLWSHPLTTTAQGGPVVVPSGVYTADDDGNVYAFTIPSATAP